LIFFIDHFGFRISHFGFFFPWLLDDQTGRRATIADSNAA
jgi:hypothetical protein